MGGYGDVNITGNIHRWGRVAMPASQADLKTSVYPVL